jgi:hypothetical protein
MPELLNMKGGAKAMVEGLIATTDTALKRLSS